MESFSRSNLYVEALNPIPIIGPIRGEINIAPITTGVELIFKPNDAMKIAKTSTIKLVPRNLIP